MIDVLVDTNILIYFLERNAERTGFFLYMGGSVRFGISVITYAELLLGLHSENKRVALEHALEQFVILPIDAAIARESASTMRLHSEKFAGPRLADTLIAHTALRHDVPLFTNNPKDFSRFRGLTVLAPKRFH